MLGAIIIFAVVGFFIYGAILILTRWFFGQQAAYKLNLGFNSMVNGFGRLVVVMIGLFFIVAIVVGVTGWQPTP
jgi:hypothetical protein